MTDRELIAELRSEVNHYKLLSLVDKKTGLHNYRYFIQHLDKEFHRAVRYKRTFSVLLIDVDDFKSYNDSYGHLEGDRLLRLLGRTLTHSIRKLNHTARYGGDEFVVILPEVKLKDAKNVATRILNIARGSLPMTISIGVSEFDSSNFTSSDVVKSADKALYKAKSKGKNRVEFKIRD